MGRRQTLDSSNRREQKGARKGQRIPPGALNDGDFFELLFFWSALLHNARARCFPVTLFVVNSGIHCDGHYSLEIALAILVLNASCFFGLKASEESRETELRSNTDMHLT